MPSDETNHQQPTVNPIPEDDFIQKLLKSREQGAHFVPKNETNPDLQQVPYPSQEETSPLCGD